MLQYDARTGRYVDASMMPTQTMAPVSAFQGQSTTPSNMQRFYDEVAFYTGQPAARQAVIPAAPQSAQPLVGVEAPQTVLSQPSVLDTTRQAPAPMQQPVSAPTGQSQIMSRVAEEPAQQEEPLQVASPDTGEILTEFGKDVALDIAKDEIKSQLGIETTSEGLKALAEIIYPGSTGVGTSGVTAGYTPVSAGQIATDLSMATPETQAAWNAPMGAETGALTTAGNVVGGAVAAYNVTDAIQNIASGSRRGKGAVEGVFTGIGTAVGAIYGGWIGAGIGSVIGRTVGRGVASLGESLGLVGGRSTKQYQIDRWTSAMENAASPEEQKFIARAMSQAAERPTGDSGTHQGGPLKGRTYNLEEIVKGGRAEDVWGEYAFFEAFPGWLTEWTEDERRMIAQAALDENLLSSDKGSVLFSGKRGDLARIQEIGYLVKQRQYQPVKTNEQRMQERVQYLNSIGVNVDATSLAQMDQDVDAGRTRMALEQDQQERAATTIQQAQQAGLQPIRGGALWKPASERDGNLVVLMPYPVGELTIRDANTGQVIAVGRSSGPSNGFADTIRFDRPGAAFQNVIIEDKYGNSIPVADGSQRLEGISVSGYGNPNQMGGFLPSFTPPPVTPLPPVKPLKKIKYKKRELPKVTYKAPKAPAQPKAPKIPAGVEKSKEK